MPIEQPIPPSSPNDNPCDQARVREVLKCLGVSDLTLTLIDCEFGGSASRYHPLYYAASDILMQCKETLEAAIVALDDPDVHLTVREIREGLQLVEMIMQQHRLVPKVASPLIRAEQRLIHEMQELSPEGRRTLREALDLTDSKSSSVG